MAKKKKSLFGGDDDDTSEFELKDDEAPEGEAPVAEVPVLKSKEAQDVVEGEKAAAVRCPECGQYTGACGDPPRHVTVALRSVVCLNGVTYPAGLKVILPEDAFHTYKHALA